MKTASALFSVLMITLSSCARTESSAVENTQGELLARYQTESAVVVKYGGPANGPYRDAGGFVGHVNQPANFSWSENGKDVNVSEPAEAGYYYQLSRFKTPTDELFWILVKLNNKEGA